MAVIILVLGFGISVIPASAHHSVPAMFDVSKEIRIRGIVSKIEWTNPHARFWVDTRNDNGQVFSWELELPPPNALKLQGLGQFIKPGDPVDVDLWQAKDGSRLGHALTVTLPDRRVLNFPRNWGMPASTK
jgi:hypothetical protein